MHNRKYDLFLSYIPLDGETVQSLASELNDAGVSVWFDQWKLVPGQNWEFSIIESAMAESTAIGICIGPKGNERWPEKEFSLALSIKRQDPSFGIIAILLPDANKSHIPAPMNRIRLLDLRKGPSDPEVIDRVKSTIRESTEESSLVRSPRRAPIVSSVPRAPLVRFVPRRDTEGIDLVERLQEELAPNKKELILLWGAGGVGKTTLAAEAARALSHDFVQRVVWISALGREDFVFSTLLDEIATQLDCADVHPLAIEMKKEKVRDVLSHEPTLVVLDNFEALKPDEQKLSLDWLSKLSRCSRLVVSREKIQGLRTIPLKRMSPKEADDFLRRLIEQSIDPYASPQLDRHRIMKESKRNPLVMQWVIGQIALAQDPDTVLDELEQGGGDAAQRVFDRSFELEQLGDDGRKTLLALSLFWPDASRAALAEVAGFGRDVTRLNKAVKSLVELWLVKVRAGGARLAVGGLTRALAKARLMRDENTGASAAFRTQFVDYFLNYVKAHAQSTPEDYDSLEAENQNLIIATLITLDRNDWPSAHKFVDIFADPVRGVWAIHDYWDEARRLIEQTLKRVKASHRMKVESDGKEFAQNLAKMLRGLGRRARDQERLDTAHWLHQESLAISKDVGDQSGAAVTLQQLARLAQDQDEVDEARRLYNESLGIQKKLGNQKGIANSLHELGRLAQNQGDLDEARALYNESLEIKKRLGDGRGIAATLHQLGNLAQDQGDLEQAQGLYNESLKIGKRDSASDFATLYELGNLAQAQGDLREARRLYHESVEISKRLDNQISIAVSLHALAGLAIDEGNKVEAGDLLRKTLDIFEKLKSPKAEIARRDLAKVEDKSP